MLRWNRLAGPLLVTLLSLAACVVAPRGTTAAPHTAQTPSASRRIPVGITAPPITAICDYPLVLLTGAQLFGPGGPPGDLIPLETARSCGTKVVVRLHQHTDRIVQDDGTGLDLAKFEAIAQRYAGVIDPYVEDGTIIAHLAIDEPHDCHDWGGECPEPAEVDQAAAISRGLWPMLPTMVNTMPAYASRRQWEHTDLINFQYSYHKGPLTGFIEGALTVLEQGHVNAIGWSIQALSGGCEHYGECPMTPERVVEVGSAMCATGVGEWLGFSAYREELLDAAMLAAIDRLAAVCSARTPVMLPLILSGSW